MKKLISTLIVTISLGVMTTPLMAEDITKVPYKVLEKFIAIGLSKKIENVEYVPLYLNHTKAGVILDPKKSKFRLRTKDGLEVPLKCDTLSDIPEAKLNPTDKHRVKDGSTHRLWVPKDMKKYAESVFVWDLPKGSVNIASGQAVPFVIPPDRS